jgi:hypothetical protein
MSNTEDSKLFKVLYAIVLPLAYIFVYPFYYIRQIYRNRKG